MLSAMDIQTDYRPEPPLSHDLYYHMENGVPVLDRP